MRRQYHSDTTSILCPFIIMSPHLCFSPVITWLEPSFWEDLFFERPLYCATKPQLINVLRFATHAIIIHFQPHFAFGNRPFSRYN